MKVAISCDTLVKRQYITTIIEALLSIDEQAEIYTLLHKKKGILGPIEMRKIHSSFLSSMHGELEQEDVMDAFWSKSFLIPSAAKKLVIPCHYDVVINISSGLSHAIKRCEGIYQITYLLEDSLWARKPKSLIEKMFASYLKSWSKKALAQADELWLPYEREMSHPNTSVLTPFIKLEDYPLFSATQTKFYPKDFITLDAPSFTLKRAEEMIEMLRRMQLKYCFVGACDHLLSLKESDSDKRFFGDRCSGELAPLLAASRAHFTHKLTGFPQMAIQSLSVGVPVIMIKGSESAQFIKDECLFLLRRIKDIKGFWDDFLEVPRETCHNYAKKYHELKFKSQVKRRLDKVPLNDCQTEEQHA